MPRFYFDVFDGKGVSIDRYGDEFLELEDAATQAEELVMALARESLPRGQMRDFGVAVRNERGRDVYRAGLIFRDAYPDPTRPETPHDVVPTLTVRNPTALIRGSQETRRQTRVLKQELVEMRERSERERHTYGAMWRQLRSKTSPIVEPMPANLLGRPRRAA